MLKIDLKLNFEIFVIVVEKLASSNEQLLKNSEKILAMEAQIADLVSKQEYTNKLLESLMANSSNSQRFNETTNTKNDQNPFKLEMFQTKTSTPQTEYVRLFYFVTLRKQFIVIILQKIYILN